MTELSDFNSSSGSQDNSGPAEKPVAPSQPFRAEGSSKKKKGCFGFIIFFTIIIMLVGALGICFLIASAMMNFSFGTSFPEIPIAKSSFRFNEEHIAGKSFSRNKIAVIDVQGVIMQVQGGNSLYQLANSTQICNQLKHVAADPAVKAVIIRLNTPGGEITASDVIHHQIKELQVTTGIPVIASMGAISASGGYYVAVACDHIIAHRLTMTGSIGVIAQTYKYYELFQKIGLQSDVYTSGPMKDLLSGSRPTAPEERKIIQDMINESYNEFVKIIADGRPNLTEEQIKTTIIGDGRVFSGQQALKLDLVDQLGFFDDAIAKAAQMAGVSSDYKVIRYQKPFSLGQIFSEAGSKVRPSEVKVELPGSRHWVNVMEPGKLYFLPKVR